MAIELSDYSRYIDEMIEIEKKMRHLSEVEMAELTGSEYHSKLAEIHREEIEHIKILEGIKSEIIQGNKS